MTTFKSDRVLIERAPETVYALIGDLQRFSRIMPEQITNWQATENECSFTIQNMANVKLRFTEKIPHSRLVLQADTGAPFPFSLITDISPEPNGKSLATVSIEAQLNPMFQMMVSRPLANLVNMLAQKLKEEAEKIPAA